jgi:hypothetical protein
MKQIKIREIRKNYKTDVACAQALGIWPATVARLIRLDAILCDSGAVYIESQTVIDGDVAKSLIESL